MANDAQRKLAALGYPVAAAVTTGEEALARARQEHYDVALMDITLAGAMDGIQAAEQIAQGNTTAIVFMTASDDDETLRRIRDVGPAGYILKPVRDRDLKMALELAMYRKRMDNALQDANAQLQKWVNELERYIAESVLVGEMGEMLQGARTLKEAYTIAHRFCVRAFPQTDGAVRVLERELGVLAPCAHWGGAEMSIAINPDHCLAFQQGQVHPTSDANELCLHCAAHPAAWRLCVPLQAQEEKVGALYLQSAASADSELQRLALTIAQYLSLAIANLQMRDLLRRQSQRDALTGLHNRRYLDETLLRHEHRARHHETTLALIMLDIDHFKRINDDYGHEAGDAVLATLGRFLKVHIRDGDVYCRYGGEEFVLVLPGASVETARERAEFFRQEAHQLRVTSGDRVLPPLTLSLGIAIYPEHGATLQKVLKCADAALYASKRAGRNRVTVAVGV